MGMTLFERLEAVRQRVRRVVWMHGFGLLVAIAIGILVFAGLADWLFHVSPGMRLLFIAGLVGGIAWTIRRHLLTPLATPLSDLELALKVESRHPELDPDLAAAVEFLKTAPDDPRAGSKALREQVVVRALARSSDVSFHDIVEPRPARKMLAWASAVAAIALALVVASPSDADIAMRRLANPFGGPAWPRRTRIENVQAVERVALGDPFEVEATIAGVVPDRVQIRYRFAGGESASPDLLRESKDRIFRGGMETVSRSFEYSIAAGDDMTPWRSVAVVPAPETTSLVVRVDYPKYTRLPPETYPQGRGHVQAVVGSTVTVAAQANKPLSEAELLLDDAGTAPAQLSPDGKTVTGSFVVQKNTHYRIVLRDREGMNNAKRSPTRFKVEALPDRAPEVTVQRPAGDVDATPNAVLPIQALAKDDFGVGAVELRYKPPAAASAPTEKDAQEVGKPLAKTNDSPKRLPIGHDWPLAPLGLKPGQILSFQLAAVDLRDLPPGPNVARSREIRIRIVAKDDLLKTIETDQQLVREELQRLLKLQETAMAQTSEVQKQAEVSGKLKASEFDKLQSTDMLQRRVREKVADSDQSLQKEIGRLLDQLKANGVQDVETERRLKMMKSELARLAEQHLPPIAKSMTDAIKSSRDEEAAPSRPSAADAKASPKSAASKPEARKPAAQELANARKHQQEVVDSIGQMLEQLEKWETIAQVATDARDLKRRQDEVATQSGKLANETLGKSKENLSTEQKQSLAGASAKQSEAAEQLQRLERKLDRLADRSSKEDPVAAASLKDALEQIKKADLNSQMTDAAKQIAQNKLSEAGEKHRDIEKSLDKLLESLEDRKEQELSRLVKQLREAESDLAQLREQQKRLLQKTREADKIVDPEKRREELKRLARQQQDLQRKATDFARRLSRLRADDASRRADRASARMDRSGQQMEQGDSQQAGDQQEQAEEQLAEAQQQLAQERRRREDELAREQLAKVSDAIRQIYDRQLKVKEETVRLDGLKAAKGRWTRGEMQSLSSLARTQTGLQAESKELTNKLSQAKVFVQVIEQAIERMKQAASLMENREAGQPTQQAVEAAANRFAQLLDSLKNDPGKQQKGNQPEEQEEGGGGGGGGGGGSGGGIPDIAQIKLLKSLQLEINEQTQQLVDAKTKTGKWNDDQQKRFSRLSELQGKLAGLVLELSEPKGEPDLKDPAEPAKGEGNKP